MDKNPTSGNEKFLRFFFLSLVVHLALGFLAFHAVSSLGRLSAYLTPKGPHSEVQLDWTETSAIKSVRSQESKRSRVKQQRQGSSNQGTPEPNSFQNALEKETGSTPSQIKLNSPPGIQVSPSTPQSSRDYEDVRKWVASLLEGLELNSAQELRFVIELTISDQTSSGGAFKITALQIMDPQSLKLSSSRSANSLPEKMLSDQERQQIQSRLDGVTLPAHLSDRAAGQTFRIPIVIQAP